MKIRKLTTAIFAASTALATQASWAQLVLEEVIVTAQKRSESVQDVPSTVNVLSADMLRNFNIQNFTDIESLSPGIKIDRQTGRSGSIAMRGITFDPSSAAEAAVTVYWNDSVVDGNTVFQQMFDMQRVEILRGPQGTLQGRSSPAGAINIHTAKANIEEMEGQVRATVQDNGGINTQFGFSVPIIEGKLAVRIAGVYDESDLSEIENVLTGDNATDEETRAARINLNWLATDTLSLDFTYQYLENEINNLTVLEGDYAGDPRLDPEGVLGPLDDFDRKGILVGPNNTDATYDNSTLAITWELPGHQLSSVTGYHETESTFTFDRADGNANPENVFLRIAQDKREDFTQELRLASTDSEFWEYMVGVYYETSEVSFTQDNLLRPGSPFAPASQVLLFPIETDRMGVFSHNKFYLSDTWTVQLGLRYQESDSERDISLVAGGDGFPPSYAQGDLIVQVLSDANKSYDTDAVTGSIVVQYDWVDYDTILYANFSTGWRPGGVTVTGSILPEEALLFGEEESVSYELGFKSTLWNGRMRLNGAVFYQDFDDYITRLTRLSVRDVNGSVNQAGITVNGDAEIHGAELELDTMLTENWHLGGGISYVDAKFKDGVTLPCNEFDAGGNPVIPEGQFAATCDKGGQGIGEVPNWTANINTEYSLSFDGFEGYSRLLYRFVDSRANEDLGALPAYSITDLHFGLRGNSWDVSLFARNLFDKEALRGGAFASQQVRKSATGYGPRQLERARLIGLSASYAF